MVLPLPATTLHPNPDPQKIRLLSLKRSANRASKDPLTEPQKIRLLSLKRSAY